MISISANLNIMIKAAEKASKPIIRDFGEVEKLQVSKKGPRDFVTKTDKNVEKILIEELLKAKKNYSIGSNVKIKFIKDRPGHDKRYAIDSKKILKQLKWKTKVSFEKGLEKTFLWYLLNNDYYKSISKNDIVKRVGIL